MPTADANKHANKRFANKPCLQTGHPDDLAPKQTAKQTNANVHKRGPVCVLMGHGASFGPYACAPREALLSRQRSACWSPLGWPRRNAARSGDPPREPRRRVVIVATWLGAEATPAHLVWVSRGSRGARARRLANKRRKQTFANRWCLQTGGRVARARKQTANKRKRKQTQTRWQT